MGTSGVRFDDSLKTVLAADASTAFGARAAFRQIVDLMARGRIDPTDAMLARVRELRGVVPVDIRAAAARGLALASPPPPLVACLAEDEPDVVATLLRAVRLDAAAWTALVPRLGPVGRSVLRRRDDLDPAVLRALESFGSTDFSLDDRSPPGERAQPVDRPAAPPRGTGPFVALGAVADALPIVAEARRRANEPASPVEQPPSQFKIAELVDRIAAYQRRRGAGQPAGAADAAPDAAPAPTLEGFRFEADADGIIRWIDAAPRGALIGASLARLDGAGLPHVDGVAAGAFRRRTAFTDARLQIGGGSALAGDWRISAVPVFEQASGRFVGYRGGARRPRIDEDAARTDPRRAAEGLRRLVHELRTPTTAIAGFSELIESELLGPVLPAYRERAAAIRAQAADLIGAIDDLDLAARIEGDALDLRAGEVALGAVLARVIADLAALAALRGCTIVLPAIDDALLLACDDRAVERLFGRLLAALVSSAAPGEQLAIGAMLDGAAIAINFTRPQALAAVPEAALLSLDAERETDLPGAPLLGTGFALRLASNLAAELGGSLTIGATNLTLRLPAALIDDMGQASTI